MRSSSTGPRRGCPRCRMAGLLSKVGDFTTAGHGAVPSRIIEMFSTGKAYIFFLEVNAQIMALVANRPRLDPSWVCSIDNLPGKAALAKGFSSEGSGFFWRLCSQLGWFGLFMWVASKLNPADSVSRGDIASATAHGAKFLSSVQDLYWSLLQRVASSMEYATVRLWRRL